MTNFVLFVLSITLLLMMSALVEMYRALDQIREFTGAIDRPVAINVDHLKQIPLPAFGLQDVFNRGLILFVSQSCATCRVIVDRLGGHVPRDVLLIVQCESEESGKSWLGFEETLPPRVVFDTNKEIARRMRINVTPVGLIVEDGGVVRAWTIPSVRQLFQLIPTEIHSDMPDHQARPLLPVPQRTNQLFPKKG